MDKDPKGQKPTGLAYKWHKSSVSDRAHCLSPQDIESTQLIRLSMKKRCGQHLLNCTSPIFMLSLETSQKMLSLSVFSENDSLNRPSDHQEIIFRAENRSRGEVGSEE